MKKVVATKFTTVWKANIPATITILIVILITILIMMNNLPMKVYFPWSASQVKTMFPSKFKKFSQTFWKHWMNRFLHAEIP